MKYKPGYIELYQNGELEKISDKLFSIIQKCYLCPHKCGIDRTRSKTGKCRIGELPVISSVHAHFGEESCLVGRKGSGTVFFTGCSLSCIFCQNYDISHLLRGDEATFRELADMMLALQSRGCHNINLVTPTHMIYPIVRALLLAIPEGLDIPLVYNSGGYDSAEVLKLLEGIIDIYMPDFKYMNPNSAGELSGVPDYPAIAMSAIKEMHRQTGDLIIDGNGIARKGLLVRHLVLPNNIASTDKVISFLADLSANTYINIMDQYRPEYRARECFDLRRRVTLEEFDGAVKIARNKGLRRIDGYF